MKENSIFIDLRNKGQVEWFNKIASKLIRCTSYTSIVETETDKAVGYIVQFNSLFKNYVIKKNATFLKDPKKVIINVKK